MSTSRICTALSKIACYTLIGAGIGIGSYSIGHAEGNYDDTETLAFLIIGSALGFFYGLKKTYNQYHSTPAHQHQLLPDVENERENRSTMSI